MLTRSGWMLSSITALIVFNVYPARAEDLPPKYREVVRKGLDWLVRSQAGDGSWTANNNTYPTSMTALAGMALLMGGSSVREGKYAPSIRKAADWLMARSQRDTGLIGNPRNPSEAERYLYGHGFALLFLASVYGEEDDADRRRHLQDILTKAVEFTGKAQTSRGGWGYVSSIDGNGFDEGSVTITQVQALRAAKNAGIAVPRSIIDKAHEYLKNCTTERGGVIYSLANGGRAGIGGERPPLTAAAVACLFNAGEYNSEYARRWLKFCQSSIPVDKSGRDSFGHWEYTHYYYAQALYALGDDGYAKLFPDAKPADSLTWSKYREVVFDYLAGRQLTDGSWTQGYIGPVFSTACHLAILQLDHGVLPIYQR